MPDEVRSTFPEPLYRAAINAVLEYIRGAKEAPELRRHVSLLLERTLFLEKDLSRVQTELSASRNEVIAAKSLSLDLEEARAKAREAQLKEEKTVVELREELAKLKQWQNTREKYEPDEATGLQKRKDTGGSYCPKCLYAEPPVEQPVPPAPEYERHVKCPVCGAELPNRYWRPPAGTGDGFSGDDFHI